MTRPLLRIEFDTQQLVDRYPPVWRHRNKQLVYEIACPPGCAHGGRITFSRWVAMALPERVDVSQAVELVDGRQDHYDYAPAAPAEAVEWHVDFADPRLFVAYGSPLFAQDEMQVAEHPALGSLKEALEAGGQTALTVESGRPTPVLVMGVERRCRVECDRDADQDRPHGLYGNAFARAPESAVRRATRPIHPPGITNLIAMAAPYGGFGLYKTSEIQYALTTAFTGFRAARLESELLGGPGVPVIVHTGFWGCGAFGGNRVLMAMLQVLAAGMAGSNKLVFHCFNGDGMRALEEAQSLLLALTARGTAGITEHLVQKVSGMRFRWGASDGN
ncbi:MAG: hypothetical protein HY013_10470 [Candidatus Solibacter usitatus]|nr:hypothetical protein [Candidatus Solibacter usitatus]